MIHKSLHRWHKTLVAVSATAMLGWVAHPAAALTLGGITIQSTLGEALQAEIDVPSISAEETVSLKVQAASAAAYAAANLEYNPAFADLQARLAQRPDGSVYIRISTTRPIQEPFVDLLLETQWASGRIVRNFTLLFDLPAPEDGAVPPPTLPQTAASPLADSPLVTTPGSTADATPAVQTALPAPAPQPDPPTTQKPSSATAQQVLVKPGDWASKIALATESKEVSLDQLLVAMLRANPEAFVQGNLNRLRAGVLLNLPSTQQAQDVDAAEAKRIVLAQSKDFKAYRRNLASNAPATPVESASRSAQGNVQTQVQAPKPAATAADKLTLSKGAAQADLSNLAQQRNHAEAVQRKAELGKNIDDLKKLSATAPTPGKGASSSSRTKPASSAPGGVMAPKSGASAAAPGTDLSAAAAAGVKPEAKSDSAPDSAPDLLDQFLQEPVWQLGAGAVLLALLGGFFWYRRFQSQQNEYQDSYLQPEHLADDPAMQAETPGAHSELPPANHPDMDLDLDLDFSRPTALPATGGDLNRDLPASHSPGSGFGSSSGFGAAPGSAAPATVDHGIKEFDLRSVSLEPNNTDADANTNAKKVGPTPVPDQGMLEAQMALAEEFFLLNDHDGARALLNEVINEAQGTLRSRAQRLLDKLV